MKIERLQVGKLRTNCYIVEKDNKCLIVDPGDDFSMIDGMVFGKEVVGILVTHNHYDHVGALDECKNKYNVEVYDYFNTLEQVYNTSLFTFEVIRTPGHKEDCITFYFPNDNVMFTGDFVFYHTVGRWDLETSSESEMYVSINKIIKYPKDTRIYPGHGIDTNISEEIQNNPYF